MRRRRTGDPSPLRGKNACDWVAKTVSDYGTTGRVVTEATHYSLPAALQGFIKWCRIHRSSTTLKYQTWTWLKGIPQEQSVLLTPWHSDDFTFVDPQAPVAELAAVAMKCLSARMLSTLPHSQKCDVRWDRSCTCVRGMLRAFLDEEHGKKEHSPVRKIRRNL